MSYEMPLLNKRRLVKSYSKAIAVHVCVFSQESFQPCKPECGLCWGWKWKLSSFWRRSLINWTACWKGWRVWLTHSAAWEGRENNQLVEIKWDQEKRCWVMGAELSSGDWRWKQKALYRASHRGLWCMRLRFLIMLPSLLPIKEVILCGQCSIHCLHWTDQWIHLVDTAEPHFHFNMSQTPSSLSTFTLLPWLSCPLMHCKDFFFFSWYWWPIISCLDKKSFHFFGIWNRRCSL